MFEIAVSLFRTTGSKIYYMQYRDPVTYKKIRQTTGEKSRDRAARKAGHWEKSLREGNGHIGGRITWENFRQRYEDIGLDGLQDTTVKKAIGVLNVFERRTGIQRLADVSTERLNEYAAKLRKLSWSENTIKSHLGHIRAVLNWAVENKYLHACPKVPMPKRAKSIDVARGRALTDEEFHVLLSVVPQGLKTMNSGASATPQAIESWRSYLRGLWWSGLRLEESLELHWSDRSRLCVVDMDDDDPALWIPGDKEKGNRFRYTPLAPEFIDLLRKSPTRDGFVFNPMSQRPDLCERLGAQQVGRTVVKIGELTGIETTPGKTASAHDLRRSFGDRWAQRVQPAILMELMRHRTITTTMKYYVGRNAKQTSKLLRAAVGTTLGNSELSATKIP